MTATLSSANTNDVAAAVAAIVLQARRDQLDLLQMNMSRLEHAFIEAVDGIIEAAKRIPDGTGFDVVRARVKLIQEVGNRLDALKRDFGQLLLVALLETSQQAADEAGAIEEAYGRDMPESLNPTAKYTATLASGATIYAMFSQMAGNVVRDMYSRTYADGLRLADRLQRFDVATRLVVERVVTEGISAGLDARTLAANIQRALMERGVETPEYIARRIAVTEIANADRAATVASFTDPMTGELNANVIGLRWNLSATHEIFDSCDGYAEESSEGLPSGVYMPEDVPDSHPNCFVSGTEVIARDVRASSMRWYEGEIVNVQTVLGDTFAVTPNHPILTRRGWIAAGLINVDDELVRYCASVESVLLAVNPHYEEIPLPIQKIASSFGEPQSMMAASVPITSEDFHGDASDGNICIIRSDGLMRDVVYPSALQAFAQSRFISRGDSRSLLDSERALAKVGLRSLGASNSIMRGTRNRALFCTRQRRHSYSSGLGLRAYRNTTASEDAVNGAARASKVRGKREDGLSCGIALADELLLPNQLRKSAIALAGTFEYVSVSAAVLQSFRGHVYNLQTGSGWYIANNIVAHNCQCFLSPEFAN